MGQCASELATERPKRRVAAPALGTRRSRRRRPADPAAVASVRPPPAISVAAHPAATESMHPDADPTESAANVVEATSAAPAASPDLSGGRLSQSGRGGTPVFGPSRATSLSIAVHPSGRASPTFQAHDIRPSSDGNLDFSQIRTAGAPHSTQQAMRDGLSSSATDGLDNPLRAPNFPSASSASLVAANSRRVSLAGPAPRLVRDEPTYGSDCRRASSVCAGADPFCLWETSSSVLCASPSPSVSTVHSSLVGTWADEGVERGPSASTTSANPTTTCLMGQHPAVRRNSDSPIEGLQQTLSPSASEANPLQPTADDEKDGDSSTGSESGRSRAEKGIEHPVSSDRNAASLEFFIAEETASYRCDVRDHKTRSVESWLCTLECFADDEADILGGQNLSQDDVSGSPLSRVHVAAITAGSQAPSAVLSGN
jgi:hypothetical protein